MTVVAEDRSRPGLFDVVDLALVRVAKRRRTKFAVPESFYETFFSEHDVVRYQLDARDVWRFSRLSRVCKGFLEPGAVVVDVGCGLGVAARFVPTEHRYLGVDVGSTNVERARQIVPSATFRVGALPDLPVGDAEVDLAVCLEVLEHVPDDEAAVAELARVLRPGGYALVSVPQTYYWPSYLALIGHYRHYTAERLDALLGRHGLSIVIRYPTQRSLWRIYHYLYVLLRVANALGRRVGIGRPTLYEGRPYSALRRVTLRAARTLELHENAAASTFVLARRREGPTETEAIREGDS